MFFIGPHWQVFPSYRFHSKDHLLESARNRAVTKSVTTGTVSNTYENPDPSPDLEARFPFVSYQFQRRPKAEMLERAQAFHV